MLSTFHFITVCIQITKMPIFNYSIILAAQKRISKYTQAQQFKF